MTHVVIWLARRDNCPLGKAIAFAVVGLVSAVLSATVVARAQDRPVFRGGTELIRVDVQVVTGKGLPVLDLGPDKFDVTINGRPRKVVSADLVTYDSARVTAERPVVPPPRAAVKSGLPGRVFMLAIDERSFLPGYAAGAIEAARGFIAKLQPADLLGFVSYPSGGAIDPTTDRAPILNALKQTVGQRQLPVVRFNLRPSDVVSLSRKIIEFAPADMSPDEIRRRNPDLVETLDRLCPVNGDMARDLCYKLLASEVQSMYSHFESEASMSIGVLRSVLNGLGRIDGRKTMVFLSGGMVVSDQAGGRPDVGNLGILIAQEAARANVVIFPLFVDWKYLQQFSASERLAPSLTNLARDTAINSHWLDEFSATAGGQMLSISAGNGDAAFDRILSESSAYYLLGVQPEPDDRDGRPRRLGVKVRQRGVTVRARNWVVVDDTQRFASATAPTAGSAENAPAPTAAAASATSAGSAQAPVTPPTLPAVTPVSPPAPVAAAGPPVRAASALPAAVVPDSPTLPFVLTNAGAYVRHYESVFADVVAEERYVQTSTAGATSTVSVPKRESRSDFLLVSLPGGTTREWFRDTFDVNGSPIRERQQRLVDIFTKPDATAIAKANAILKESATYNIGIDRNINLPSLGLEVLRPDQQRRFKFSGGSIDRTLSAPAYVVAFAETARPSLIRGTNGSDLLVQGRAWIDVKTGFVVKTEFALDDANVTGTISVVYRLDPAFGVAVPVEMKEDYTEVDGRRTIALATYSRFRRFDVETREVVPTN